jgi:hypothetical protein
MEVQQRGKIESRKRAKKPKNPDPSLSPAGGSPLPKYETVIECLIVRHI